MDDIFEFFKTRRFKGYFLLGLVALLGPYLGVFHDGFSSDPNHWGAFGSYVSGILGPVLSALSMLVIVWTVLKQIDSEKKKLQIQISHDKQEHKEQVIREKHEEIYRKLSIILNSYSHLYNNILYRRLNSGISLDSLVEARRNGKDAISKTIQLIRLYSEPEIEKQVRMFIDHASDFFNLNAITKYIRDTVRSNGFMNDIDIETFYDVENYYSWFDEISQLVIDRVKTDSIPPSYYYGDEYKKLKIQTTYLKMKLGEAPTSGYSYNYQEKNEFKIEDL